MNLIDMLDAFFGTAPKTEPPPGMVWAAVFDKNGEHTGWRLRPMFYRL